MKNEEIELFLGINVDKKYRDFHSTIVPHRRPMLGVRIPVMRELARRIARSDNFAEFWRTYPCNTYEDVMVRGMSIGYLRGVEAAAIVGYVRDFVPLADNWAHVDCVCAGLKVTSRYRSEMLSIIEQYISSSKEFEIRFGVVMLMSYYLTDEYINLVLAAYGSLHSHHYYVQMGIAWGVATSFVKFRTLTLELLQSNSLEITTHNMAIRKITDSFRVSAADKTMVRTLKR